MITKECLVCENDFDVSPSREDKAKFCSRECFHEGQRQGKTSHSERRVEYQDVECTGCGKIVEKPPSRVNRSERQFCTQECYYDWNAEHQKNQTGRRERMREKQNASCEICNFERFVEMAHIVPSRDGGTFHESNIVMLCPNHHRLFDHGGIKLDEVEEIEGKLRRAVCDGDGWTKPTTTDE